MSKGLLIDFEVIARPADGDPGPLLQEIRNLGYEVYHREFQAACDYVLYVGVPQREYDGAERFLEAVFKHFDVKPKRTDLMALAPVFAELHRYTLHDDATRSLPVLAKGRKIAVLSALPRFLVAPVLEPVKAHVAAVVTPKEAKAVPPNPEVLRTAMAAIKLRAKDVAFVSTDCADLAAAKSLELRTVFVGRQGDAACGHAAIAVRSLDELEAALQPAPAKSQAVAPPSAPG